MADTKRRRSGRVRAPGILLAVLFTLVLAAAAAVGVWLWADSRSTVTDRVAAHDAMPRSLSLFSPQTPVSAGAPEPVAAPEIAGSEELPFNIVEIIGEEEGLTVARIQGKRYKGFVAIVEDPLRLTVGVCPYFSNEGRGRTVKEMVEEFGAVLGINGGGFADPNGNGTGAMPTGNVISGGVVRYAGGGPTVGMDAAGRLYAGEYTSAACRELGLQWAVSYGPTLISDGQIRPGLSNNLEEPRTAVGQREDGTVILLNIQGRQASALGVTCQELADILFGMGCINAGNLDGGASADMFYNGDYVNICNTSGGPRPMPTTVLVMPLANAGSEEGQG